VLFTDVLLYALIHDRAAIARFETAKGWAFVGLTALLLFAITMRSRRPGSPGNQDRPRPSSRASATVS
jgi:hypothetical protein